MTAYRKATPYRKPQTYRGSELVPAVAPPNTRATVAGPWDRPMPGAVAVAGRWRGIAARGHVARLAFAQNPGQHAQLHAMCHKSALAHDVAALLRFDGVTPHARAAGIPYSRPTPHDRAHAAPFGDLVHQLSQGTALPQRSLAAHGAATMLPWGQLAAHVLQRSALWRAIVARGGYVALPWGPIAARSAGVRIDWPVQPPPGIDPLTVPILPVYVMLPTLTAVRLPERTPLPLLSISLQHDAGSWAWTFSAPMSFSARDLLDTSTGVPPEIEVTVNGFTWTFLVDGVDDNRRFGSRTLTVRGRSRSAELDEPYALARTFTQAADRTIAQLATDELTGRGWTLVWNAPDYLVPGGTFGYQDLAPMAAIAQLANAIGAAIAPDPAGRTLTVAPTYPTSPWAWAAGTPYAILPASILTDGDSSWQGGANANGVYVYAENAASGALVKIAGTDGAQQVPMIVERLAVHADAQRERGRNELAAAGRKQRVGRTVPLFPAVDGQPDLGVVPVGALVEVQDVGETWRGQVMGVRIDAQRNGSALSVRQHLTIERQYR